MLSITIERRDLPTGCEAIFTAHEGRGLLYIDWGVTREHASRLLLDLVKRWEPGEAIDHCPHHPRAS